MYAWPSFLYWLTFIVFLPTNQYVLPNIIFFP